MRAKLLCRWNLICALVAIFSIPNVLSAQTLVPGAAAEWHRAADILVHTPGRELLMGVVHPEAALFENVFSTYEAANEHREYQAQLTRTGARVHNLVDLLARASESELLPLARTALTYDDSALKPEHQACSKEYREKVLASLDKKDLIDTIVQRPKITLTYKNNTLAEDPGSRRGPGSVDLPPCADFSLLAKYELSPVMNLYFTRDQLMTTARGLVLTRMAVPQRAIETEIVRFAVQQLGVSTFLEIKAPGTVEGGDFLPAGNWVFIGQGLRTNDDAIQQLLAADAFRTSAGRSPGVIVVKDPWLRQEEMHLDTYFNIIDSDLAVLVADRFPVGNVCEGKCPKVDIWVKGNDGKYTRQVTDQPFATALANLRFEVIPVSKKNQQAYGINFLTVRARNILIDQDIDQEYRAQLAAKRVTTTYVNFSNLKMGFGAAHCTTQVVRRIAP